MWHSRLLFPFSFFIILNTKKPHSKQKLFTPKYAARKTKPIVVKIISNLF